MQMKKILAISIIASTLLFSSCALFNSKEAEIGFFDPLYLTECKLWEIPTPNSEDMRRSENIVYCNMTETERKKYIDSVVAYLIEKDDIYYKGYHYETGNPGGIFFLPEYRFAPLAPESNYSEWFAFSLNENLNTGDEYNHWYSNGITIKISKEEGKIGSYNYNTVIVINNDPNFISFYSTEN